MKKFCVDKCYIHAAENEVTFLVYHLFQIKINPRVLQESHTMCAR
jgi:hypothetical protein